MAVRDIPELKSDILALKQKTDTTVLAHYYQDPDVADIADCIGDSVELALYARDHKCRRAVVCGVSFVAETVKLLAPDTEVILAHAQARCPMIGQIHPGRIAAYREEHPDACIAACMSTRAELKALCDVCVSASNAIEVLRAVDAQEILFAGDGHLGEYIAQQLPEKHIETWACECPVFSFISRRDIELAREKWPDAVVAANNSCCAQVRACADMVGSTADIIRYCEAVDRDVIIADEANVCSRLCRRFPERRFHQPAPSQLICNNMRITGLEICERAIKGEFGSAVSIPPRIREDALISVNKMFYLLSGERTYD